MDSKIFFEGIGIYRHKYLEQGNPNEYYFCEGMASGEGNHISEGIGNGFGDGEGIAGTFNGRCNER